MKIIFLTENEGKCRAVYDEKILARLRKNSLSDETVYKKNDVLSNPKSFADTEIIFSTWGMPSFTKSEIKSYFPSLKYIFYAAGSVQKFARPFLESGIKVFSAWAANAVPVAEYTVAQIILANKDFFSQSRLMSVGQYDEARRRKGAHMGNYRKNIGIIGCGMIGSLVASMLKKYDLNILVYDPFLSDEKAEQLGVSTCSLKKLFSSCSVISNHLANNDATQGMLRYEHFSSMCRYATFINTGRGAQVVENELAKALSERPDLTALLDVTYPEPPEAEHPFYSLPNCFLTPHIAGSQGSEVVRMAEYMVEEYESCLSGKPCRYEVTLKMLETMA